MKKIKLGQFYTTKNPFKLTHFDLWFNQALKNSGNVVLEPFAGTNSLIKMLKNLGYIFRSDSFDIEPADKEVFKYDTLKNGNWPRDYKLVITNPPWLNKCIATRRQIIAPFDGFDNLYKKCLNVVLKNTPYVGILLPATFISYKNKFAKSRLESITFYKSGLFNDTEQPVLLALFSPNETTDTKIYIENDLIGYNNSMRKKLDQILAPRNKAEVIFNEESGNLGVITVDKVGSKNIRFCPVQEIIKYKVDKGKRYYIRIKVDFNITPKIISDLNKKIAEVRDHVEILITAFKGYIKNTTTYRKRMNFGWIKKIIQSLNYKVCISCLKKERYNSNRECQSCHIHKLVANFPVNSAWCQKHNEWEHSGGCDIKVYNIK